MAIAKAWLDFIIKRIDRQDFFQHFQIKTQTELLKICTELIASENLEGLS